MTGATPASSITIVYARLALDGIISEDKLGFDILSGQTLFPVKTYCYTKKMPSVEGIFFVSTTEPFDESLKMRYTQAYA